MSIFSTKHRWLVTGAAGFIGSNLVDALLGLGQEVVGLDNLSTGKLRNLRKAVRNPNFKFQLGDIRRAEDCHKAVSGVEGIFHQAAIASVPLSIKDPASTHEVNVTGTFNLLKAAIDLKVKRMVYASSSSIYGDNDNLPLMETEIPAPLSPYALSKLSCEHYAQTFNRCYDLETVGLRYFNVYGPRQDPNSPYSGVISLWAEGLQNRTTIKMFGDGTSTRDYCFVDDVTAGNILAMEFENKKIVGNVYNIGTGSKTSITSLWISMCIAYSCCPVIQKLPAREGDIQHSVANIQKSREELLFNPKVSLSQGLDSLRHSLQEV